MNSLKTLAIISFSISLFSASGTQAVSVNYQDTTVADPDPIFSNNTITTRKVTVNFNDNTPLQNKTKKDVITFLSNQQTSSNITLEFINYNQSDHPNIRNFINRKHLYKKFPALRITGIAGIIGINGH